MDSKHKLSWYNLVRALIDAQTKCCQSLEDFTVVLGQQHDDNPIIY